MDAPNSFIPSENILSLLETVSRTESFQERKNTIEQLAKEPDSSRVLIELWNKTTWRATKLDILEALSKNADSRSLDFLFKISSSYEDLAMARHAIGALGYLSRPRIGEFLISLLSDPNHPLITDIVTALSYLKSFPYGKDLENLLKKNQSSYAEAHIILALSKLKNNTTRTLLHKKLDQAVSLTENTMSILYIAAGIIGNQNTIEILKAHSKSSTTTSRYIIQNSINQIRLQEKITVEDGIEQIISASSYREKEEALPLLRGSKAKEIKEAFELLKEDSDLETESMIRSLCCENQNSIKENLKFLLDHAEEISIDALSFLYRSIKNLEPHVFDHIKTNLHQGKILSLLSEVRDFNGAIYLLDQFAKDPSINILNTLSAQLQLWQKDSEIFSQATASLLKQLSKHPDIQLKSRIIRSFGQLRINQDYVRIELAKLLKTSPKLHSSIYWTLSEIGSSQSLELVSKRLGTIASDEKNELEIIQAVQTLAKLTPDKHGSLIEKINEKCLSKIIEPTLSVLIHSQSDKYLGLIKDNLDSDIYQNKVLAAAASEKNTNEEIQNKLFEYLNTPSPALRGRALNSLCLGGTPKTHRKLLEWIESNSPTEQTANKIFTSMHISPGGSYASLKTKIENMMQSDLACMKSPQTREYAAQTLERIAAANYTPAAHISAKDTVSHQLDDEIKNNLNHYEKFSANIKSVIRNAELTLGNPDLFNEQVDKSNVIIQFSKSIELLLQEKMGSILFGKDSSKIIISMQNRILQLGLNDESIKSGERIKILECGKFFDFSLFPNHKLNLVVSAIMSGKIAADQYRTIDGLRAWSIILLLFARDIQHRGKKMSSILLKSDQSPNDLAEVCAKMNVLQELRNRAAHGGTLLEKKQINEIRTYSIEVLNSMGTSLGL